MATNDCKKVLSRDVEHRRHTIIFKSPETNVFTTLFLFICTLILFVIFKSNHRMCYIYNTVAC